MVSTLLKRIYSWFAGSRRAKEKEEHAPNKSKGARGELEAYRFLRESGYRIVARNYRKPFGEIDLIGWDKEVLVFIEVKTRLSDEHGRPEEAVNRTKQKQICRVANEYRSRHQLHDINYRFDIVSIRKSGGRSQARLIKGAFSDSG